MDLLLTLIILAAIIAIVWYILSRLPLPEPIRIVIEVVIALIAIIVLLQLAPGVGGGMHLGCR